MPASIKRIRESWSVKPTPRDKGLTLTVKVTAYDNGMVEVDGIPINVEPMYALPPWRRSSTPACERCVVRVHA